ncbi:hypothetical protein [Algoriphagus pacificus]|uniref:Uncharacterized protein n=1 Tax=Algoriphagus pacificus TaxID=2811234 RepID=A0ABS3CJW6_9BACT|nr:hypothetical protein [Algoriphagus pacificus]MBN7816520.1 hypothetical protein [Algoriphagus pacificus]
MKFNLQNRSVMTSGICLWMTSILLFSFFVQAVPSPSKNQEHRYDHVQQASFPVDLATILEESIEIPGFEFNPTWLGLANSGFISVLLDPKGKHLSATFFKKSLALFDVKITFLQFFYTW